MAHRIGLVSFLVLLAAGCATAGEHPAAETAAHPGAPKVDAVTRASWRELTPDEIITADDLRKEMLANPKLELYDARGKADYDKLHIEGAKLPLPAWFYSDLALAKEKVLQTPPNPDRALEQSMAGKPKDTPLVAYCNRDCKASAALLVKLKNQGFTNVRAMEEGLQAWEEKGYPTASSTGEIRRLSGL